MKIVKVIQWDMGHRVMNHRSICKGLHGHRYKAEICIEGELIEKEGVSEEGMVIDFDIMKKLIKNHIHDKADHRFMVYEGDPILRDKIPSAIQEELNFLLVPFIPTVENIVRWCYDQLHNHMPKEVFIANCLLWETPNHWAEYKPH